jgi:DNA-binding GntR family transcriptional regulator
MKSDTPPGVDGAVFLSSAAGAVPSRTVVVLDAIKHAILTGELRPGQGLVEADLAAVLGVSKTPVREALKTRAVARGGTWDEARHALERSGHAADQADRSLANRDFHRGLYLGCGNALLISVLGDLRDQTALVSAAAWQRAPTWADEAAEHQAFLAAAAAGDADTASRLLKAHIESFLTRSFPDLGGTDAT